MKLNFRSLAALSTADKMVKEDAKADEFVQTIADESGNWSTSKWIDLEIDPLTN